MMDLFDAFDSGKEEIEKDVYLLRGFALQDSKHLLLSDIQAVINQAPLRHMMTPMGFAMSAAMTNCGELGWVSNQQGYRYDTLDPGTGKAWPRMPASFFAVSTNCCNRMWLRRLYTRCLLD